MAAPVFQDGVTPLNQTVFNLLGAEVNKKVDLPGGAVTNGQWLKGVGGAVVWSSIGVGDLPTGIPPANIGGGYAPNKVTVGTLAAGPPASPATNDIWIATDVDANGTCWQFRYNGASASAFKWEFIGGSDAIVWIPTVETTTTTGSFIDLATVGPRFVCVRAGEYDATGLCSFYHSTGANAYAQIGVFGPGGVAGVSLPSVSAPAGFAQPLPATGITPVTAGNDVRIKYYASVPPGTFNFSARYLRVRPVRVS